MQNATFTRNLAIYASALVSASLAVDSYPGDLCCRMYEHPNYSGHTHDACFDYDTYGKDGEQYVSLSNFQNVASSWWCGKNVAYDFCHNGESDCHQSGAGNARSPQIGFDNHVNGIKFSYYDSFERGAVTVFTDAYCKNVCGRFQVPEALEQTAWVNYETMFNTVYHTSNLGSVMVPYGYSFEMYNSDGFVDT